MGIIEKAKLAKKNQLTAAKEDAQADLEAFRARKKKEFDEEVARKGGDSATQEEDRKAKEQTAQVDRDYEQNKKTTIDYIVGKVLNVQLELTETQKQALRNGTV